MEFAPHGPGLVSQRRMSSPRIGFLIGSPQDYHQLLPLIAAQPEARRTIIVRCGLATPRAVVRRQAIAARLQALGYPAIEATGLADVPWETLDALVSASESTANSDHALNAAFIIHARHHQLPTFQLQHGIVPRRDFPQPIVWFAEHYLAWGTNVPARRAFVRPWQTMRYTVTGCPKFDAYAEVASTPVRAAELFGAWAAPFDRTVLVATNLHWSQHRSDHGIWPAIRDLVDRSPRDLFILKLHPVEEPPPELAAFRRPNLLVLDEIETLRLGLDSARLVLASDAVICTLSTIALEAALAARPFLILDTGNPNRYHGTRPIPPADLAGALPAVLQRRPSTRSFIDHYVDRGTIGMATTNVLHMIARAVHARRRHRARPPTTSSVTLQALDAFATLLVQRDGHAAALEAAIVEKDKYATVLLDQLAQKNARLARAGQQIETLTQAVAAGGRS